MKSNKISIMAFQTLRAGVPEGRKFGFPKVFGGQKGGQNMPDLWISRSHSLFVLTIHLMNMNSKTSTFSEDLASLLKRTDTDIDVAIEALLDMKGDCMEVFPKK